MMKRNKLITGILAMLLVLPLFLGLSSAKDVMAAPEDEMQIVTQKVILHKLKFTGSTLPTIENDGDILTGHDSTKRLEGAVFTAYDVSATYWNAYDTTEGTESQRTAAAEAAVKDITSAVSYDFGPTDDNGKADNELPIKSTVDGKERNAIYRFVETTVPDGVIQGSSVPFILGLPVYEGTTDTLKTNVNIYPKNLLNTVTLEFTKYGVATPGNPEPLENAEFILRNSEGNYFATDTNDFTVTSATDTNIKKFISDSDGKVTTGDLALYEGVYKFYEVDSTVSKDLTNYDATKYYYSKNPAVVATVNADMTVSYESYDIKGNEQGGLTAEVYNYKVPGITKEVDDPDVDVDQDVTFHITHEIPDNLGDYTEYSLVDTFDSRLVLSNDEFTKIQTYFKAFAGTVTREGNKFTVTFDMGNFKEYAGKSIDFTVTMTVASDTTMGSELKNKVDFINNIDPKEATATVKTYGKKFVKEDVDSGAKLAGAKFYVKKELDKETVYLATNKTDGKRAWVQTMVNDKGERVFVEGYEPVVLTSDSDGAFQIDGLAKTENGETTDIQYALEEFEAPEGFILSATDFVFTADDGDTVKDPAKLQAVPNKHKGSLPSTGGTGIVAFVLIGVVAVGGAALYFTKGRRHIEG